jgi:hypothetical protein
LQSFGGVFQTLLPAYEISGLCAKPMVGRVFNLPISGKQQVKNLPHMNLAT